MALPLIILAAAAASALYGARNSKLAAVTHKAAEEIVEKAQEAHRRANEKLQRNMEAASNSLHDLGRMKQQIYENSLRDFVQAFGLIQRIQITELQGFENMKSVDEMIEAIQEDISLVDNVKTLAKGTVGGALTAFGAYSAVTTFSTTAVAGASGAAAVGTGIALPTTAVAAGSLLTSTATLLGGAFVGPALAIAGKVALVKAQTKESNAKEFSHDTNDKITQLNMKASNCIAIKKQADKFFKLLGQLNALFWPRVKKMRQDIEREGLDPTTYSRETIELMSVVVALAKTISTVLNANIVNEKGQVEFASEMIYQQVEKYVKDFNRPVKLISN